MIKCNFESGSNVTKSRIRNSINQRSNGNSAMFCGPSIASPTRGVHVPLSAAKDLMPPSTGIEYPLVLRNFRTVVTMSRLIFTSTYTFKFPRIFEIRFYKFCALWQRSYKPQEIQQRCVNILPSSRCFCFGDPFCQFCRCLS